MRVRRLVVATLAVVALLAPTRMAIGFNASITRASTHRVAYDWIVQNVPRGSKVAIEELELRLPGRHYRVQFAPIRVYALGHAPTRELASR